MMNGATGIATHKLICIFITIQFTHTLENNVRYWQAWILIAATQNNGNVVLQKNVYLVAIKVLKTSFVYWS